MCGYWYSNNTLPTDEDLINVRRRGPDGFQRLENELGNFSHALLITKPPRYDQPVVNAHGVMLYNGSIYNVKDNDTIWLKNQFDNNLDNCIEVIKQLRGEYSITYVSENFVIFAVDQFSTRSLWYYFSQEQQTISISSTPDVLRKYHTGAWPCEENTIYVLDKHTWQIKTLVTTEWNLDQTITNYDRVFEEFESAVQLRYTDQALIPISSGYDSGVIACCLSEKFKIKISVAGFKGKENLNILAKRLQKHRGVILSDIGSDEQYKADTLQITKQRHSIGIAGDRFKEICLYTKSLNKCINITGRGGDEIYADYGFNGKQLTSSSRFGGFFPENLRLIYPWWQKTQDFIDFNVLQDCLYGYHGTEARVPLMDQKLIQAWLNTTQKLKNSRYKGWMAEYMDFYNYPFSESDLKKAGWVNPSK